MYESEAEQDALDNKSRDRNQARALADDYHAKSWVAGVLTTARRAPYKHLYGESASFYINLKTSHGTRQFWGTDLERAIAQSKSRVRVGDKIGVRITHQEEFTVAIKVEKSEDPTEKEKSEDPTEKEKSEDRNEKEKDEYRIEERTFNHFEVEKAIYIVARQRVARRLVEESQLARRALKEGKVVAASAQVASAADTLADEYRLSPHHRKSFVESVKVAAGLLPAPGPPTDAHPTQPLGRRELDQRRAQAFSQGAWIAGRLAHAMKAPYRHDRRNSESTLIKLQTSYGTQRIWGVDLERALRQSRSHVKVGDLVAVRITQTNARATGRSFHRYEIENQRYIAHREQLAREILDDPIRARRQGRSGKMTEAAYLLMKATSALADAQMMDDTARKQFVDGVKAAAAIPKAAALGGRGPSAATTPRNATQSPNHSNESLSREAFARE